MMVNEFNATIHTWEVYVTKKKIFVKVKSFIKRKTVATSLPMNEKV